MIETIMPWVLPSFISVFIGYVAVILMKEWKEHGAGLKIALENLYEKFENLVGKTGIEFPPEYHAKWDEIVSSTIAWLNNFFTDGKQIRNFLRFLLTLKDSNKRDAYITELTTIIEQKATQASPELTEVINAYRDNLAQTAIAAKASVSLPAQFVATKDIKADVKASVIAEKPFEHVEKTPAEILAEFQSGKRGLHGK